MIVTGIILVIIFIILQGLLSCTEMSVVSSNKLKIKYLAKNGDLNAEILENFIDKKRQTKLI